MKSNEQYVKTQFWIELQQRYDLEGVTVFDGLEEPVLAQAVNKEVVDCLQQARSASPSSRTPLSFIIVLQYAEDLNDTEIYRGDARREAADQHLEQALRDDDHCAARLYGR